jgi:hypothetical protein
MSPSATGVRGQQAKVSEDLGEPRLDCRSVVGINAHIRNCRLRL